MSQVQNNMKNIIYCKILLFIGHLLLSFSWVGQSKNFRAHQILIHFSKITYNLKSTNSGVHEHVYQRQTTKFCANEIKWFPSMPTCFVPRVRCRSDDSCSLALQRWFLSCPAVHPGPWWSAGNQKHNHRLKKNRKLEIQNRMFLKWSGIFNFHAGSYFVQQGTNHKFYSTFYLGFEDSFSVIMTLFLFPVYLRENIY